MPAIGIGIVTYNRLAYLKKVIEQVRLLTSEPYELVVADDGSTDGTIAYLDAANVRYVTGPNRGVCWNKNRALAALESLNCDPILLVEDDCFPVAQDWDVDWRKATAKWHHVCFAHPKIQPYIISGSGTPDDPFVNQKATAQCASASVQLLDKIGFFDTRFRGYGVGHAEWTTRAKRAGYGFKQVTLPSGQEARVNLYIPGGLEADDAPTFKDRENIRRNEELFAQIKRESLYRFPWRTEEEKDCFRRELEEAGFTSRLFGEGGSKVQVQSTIVGRADGPDAEPGLVPIGGIEAGKVKNTMATEPLGFNTQAYWDNRYAKGGTSGPGSIRELARYKNRFLNRFINRTKSVSVIEFGCGDGQQLRNARYPEYYGLDISAEAVGRCRTMYAKDKAKQFYTIDKIDQVPSADVCLSLDVIYHILDDRDYLKHLQALFRKSKRFVVIYGNDIVLDYNAQHIRLRDFVGDVSRDFPGWVLAEFHRNPHYSCEGTNPRTTWANFFVFERRSEFSLVPHQGTVATSDPEGALKFAIGDVQQHVRRSYPELFLVAPEQLVGAVHIRSSIPGAEEIGNCAHDTMFVVDRTVDSLDAAMKLEGAFYCKDVSGAVRDKVAREKYLFLIRAPRPRVVVSLTTISSRLETIGKVLKTIIDQSVVPDAIVINLSEDPYLLDNGIPPKELPGDLNALVRSSLVEINWVKNTGPFRKLVDTVARFKDSNTIIVTADDDMLLPRDWLLLLLREYQRSGCSVSFRSRLMTQREGNIGPYRDWQLVTTEENIGVRSPLMLATGKHGVLYHVSFFTDALFDKDFQECAPGADDLFYKACLALSDIDTVNVQLDASDRIIYDVKFGSVKNEGPALWDTNKKLNDAKMKKLIEYGQIKYNLAFGRRAI